MTLFLIACGGFIGSILRAFISVQLDKRLSGTLTVNISGSLLLAFLFYLYQVEQLSQLAWAFLGVGFCGAYTTFSTFNHEVLELILNKKYKRVFLYVSSSYILSIFLVAFIAMQ